MNVARWEPEKSLANKAYELLKSLNLKKSETIYLILDDTKKGKRGKKMDALGWVHDPLMGKSIWGHQYLKATIQVGNITIPFAVRIYVKDKDCKDVNIEFRKITELAAELITEFHPPCANKVVVLFDSYYLCPVVVKACRRKNFHFVSTLKSNRNLNINGRKLKAGTYGQTCFRTKPRVNLKVKKVHGTVTYSYVDIGKINVSKIGSAHVVFSRKNNEKKIIALVTDHPRLNASGIIKAYAQRWNIEVFFKDSKQLLGLGRYQNRSYRAAVNHLHLVCFAYALLTHIAITGTCAPRTVIPKRHASLKDTQNLLRCIIWKDTVGHLKNLPNGNSVLKELSFLLVAA